MKQNERKTKMLWIEKRLFPRFYSTFQELYSGKDLEELPVVSIDAHKISTATVSDHVKPYAAVVVKVSKKVMRECGHLKFMLGVIKRSSSFSKYY